jgi:hypothetical protein
MAEFFPSAVGCQELAPEARRFNFVATLQTALGVRISFLIIQP